MTRRLRPSFLAPLTVWLAAASLAPGAFASGFHLREQSPAAQGMSFAGASSGGADLGSMFFNPATMSLFEGNQAVLGLSAVMPTAKLEGAEGTYAAGLPIQGEGSTPNAAKAAVLPNLYAMWSVSPGLKLGLSVNAPFGMSTHYDEDFVGRYHARKTELEVLDLAPSFAYRINPQWSIGGAVVARHAKATLTNMVDFGTIGAAYHIPGFHPGSHDGQATLKGSDWAYGYRLGVLFQPTERFRIGLAHQSAIAMNLRGHVAFDDVPLQLSQAISDSGASAAVDLPATTSLGFSIEATPTLSFHGELARTGWSSFRELRVKFSNGTADNVTEERWRDTWFYALGLAWKVTDAWTLRTGVAHDQCAVQDPYRTPRIPDGDRTWLSAGAGYAVSQKVSLDFAYTHIFLKDGKLKLKAEGPDLLRGSLDGNYKNHIDIVSAQVRFTF